MVSPQLFIVGIDLYVVTALIIQTAPDPEILERGGSPLAVIYSITNFLFSNEII